jgi:hypothetical protein
LKLRPQIRTAAWILSGTALSIATCVPLIVVFTWLLPSSLNKERAIGYMMLAILMAFATSCFAVGVLVGRYAGSAAATYGAFAAGTVFACWVLAAVVGGSDAGILIAVIVGFAC